MKYESYNAAELHDVLNWLHDQPSHRVVCFQWVNHNWVVVIEVYNGHHATLNEWIGNQFIVGPDSSKRTGRPKGSKNKDKNND